MLMTIKLLLVYGLMNSFFCAAHAGDAKDINAMYRKFDAGDDAQTLLGLELDRLLASNKILEAKQLINKNLSNNDLKPSLNWRLLKIAIREERLANFRKLLLATKDLGVMNNLGFMKEIYKLLPRQKQAIYVQEIEKAGDFFKPTSPSRCPFFESVARKDRALLLFRFISDHHLKDTTKKQILHELYINLPENINASELKKLKGFASFFNALSVADLVKRMELLLTFGQNLESRATFLDRQKSDKKLTDAQACELNYVDAKVDRKLRRYAVARQRFAQLATTCSADIQKKSKFMDLQIASLTSDEASLNRFSNFVEEYPNDSLSDDVLLFKANLLTELGRIDEADKVLQQIATQYPDGDMIHRALFVKAFNQARMGKTAAAIEALKSLENVSKPGTLSRASAQYWAARLSLFPDLSSLKISPNSGEKNAKKVLHDVFAAKNPTIYSWMAKSLLEKLGDSPKRPPRDAKNPKTYSDEIATTNRFANVRTLIEKGFRSEALHILNEIKPDKNDLDGAVATILAYEALNRVEACHQRFIRCDEEFSSLLDEKIPDIYRKVSYPKPYLEEVRGATKHVDVPPAVIFAVMRQESGFLANACSWAGAKGLMQIILSSAKAAGRSFSLNDVKDEDLYQPKLNILLGSSILQKYWQQFGNLVTGLSAYNAGPTMARAWLKKNNDGPLDTLLENISFGETRNYVKHVAGSAVNYMLDEGLEHFPPLDLDAQIMSTEERGKKLRALTK